jgi:hypothetical protein
MGFKDLKTMRGPRFKCSGGRNLSKKIMKQVTCITSEILELSSLRLISSQDQSLASSKKHLSFLQKIKKKV